MMRIILFTHPTFLGSLSMPRFARFLVDGMTARGHHVETWTPTPRANNLPAPQAARKWLGYIDQYMVFPSEVRRRLRSQPADTLFVFADQALGPWVPLVAERPHVIHCHDFLAQRSAVGEIPENPTTWTGVQYQAFIRRGYQNGRNFISVSERTRQDLGEFHKGPLCRSELVYNGLNQDFSQQSSTAARRKTESATGHSLPNGFILHVGGNQWYKNRIGVIEIYNAWRNLGTANLSLPLLLIGPPASNAIRAKWQASPYKQDIHLLDGLDDSTVRSAYASASVFLFPSLAEGFGWPIAEAMASGCPVITTGEAPMTEVAGNAAILIPKRPHAKEFTNKWALESAQVLQKFLSSSAVEREKVIASGIESAKRFDANCALNQIELHYQEVLLSSQHQRE